MAGVVGLLITSLGLALVIWFLIIDSQNEEVEAQLRVAVMALNAPSELATASNIPTVSITLTGRPEDVERATIEDFEASIDLTGLAAGRHEIPIFARSLDSDLRVRRVTPETVEVTLEEVVERTVQVSVAFSNTQPLGFEHGEPVLSSTVVVVSGIQQLVDLVDTVVAPVDVGGATVDQELTVTLQARTNAGAAISGLQIEPNVIDVTVPIRQEIFPRALAVAPDLTGAPAVGYRVATISVEPLSVVVVGTLEALEGAIEAPTAPISIEGLSADFVQTIAVRAPDGLALEEETRVVVRVRIEAVLAQGVFSIDVELLRLGEGLEATVFPAAIDVTVLGPAPEVASLVDVALGASADLGDLDAGVHRVPIRISFSGTVEVTNVFPETVTVVIGVAEPEDEVEEAAADGETR